MRMNPLGRTDLLVSEICLGTMTWGTQTEIYDAHAQIEKALDAGVNFFDTAEMYPVNPVSKETVGRTERILGLWFEKSGRRDDVILATKHSGEGLKSVRDGAPISSDTIPTVVEGNLRRLRTDYIDLYQLHWPNRGSYHFRKNWGYDVSMQDCAATIEHMEDVLEELQRQVDKGNIRYFGLSNESAWGTMQWARIAEERGWPRPVSIQNEYSMMCRLFDTDLAETAHNEDIGLLAYSPLAAGMLSGKYSGGKVPEASRMSLVPELGGRVSPRSLKIADKYVAIAKKHGLHPVHMALAWCMQRPFMTSTIIGTTNLSQLGHDLKVVDIRLSKEVLDEVDAVHRANPMPF